ncbi:MAG: iron-sulfur cluster assembly scaffold protein [Leptospirales bacterium]|nr:iron-sulfur cluster assembly scaffold protein [Leptospirales bacterium]
MGKNDLIGGSLWEQYSEKVSARMNNPKYMGEITEEQAVEKNAKLVVADYGSEACGDSVRLYWLVDPSTNKIIDAKFKSFGCGTAIASNDVMSEMCIGLTVDEAIKITNIDVEKQLRDDPDKAAVPPQKMHCSVMAYDVIKKAASIYKDVDLASLIDTEIVCECAQVSLSTIKEVIKINDLTAVEEITRYTKAGAFCKSCIKPGGHEKRLYYLEDILRDTRTEMERERLNAGPEFKQFSELTLIQRHGMVQKVISESILPMLNNDGGSVEVVDMKDAAGEVTDIYIRYKGACASCAASRTSTYEMINSTLKEKVDQSIRLHIL